jgi:hypothetical protein
MNEDAAKPESSEFDKLIQDAIKTDPARASVIVGLEILKALNDISASLKELVVLGLAAKGFGSPGKSDMERYNHLRNLVKDYQPGSKA